MVRVDWAQKRIEWPDGYSVQFRKEFVCEGEILGPDSDIAKVTGCAEDFRQRMEASHIDEDVLWLVTNGHLPGAKVQGNSIRVGDIKTVSLPDRRITTVSAGEDTVALVTFNTGKRHVMPSNSNDASG